MSAALHRWLWQAQWRAQPGRMLAAAVAVAIGVALALAIHLINRSALDEFSAAIATVNGEAHAQLKARARSFDESLYPQAARAAGVAAASPVIDAEFAVVEPAADGASSQRAPSLRVIGLDVFRAAAVTPALLPSAAEAPARAAGSTSSASGAASAPDGSGSPAGDGEPAEGSSSPLFADDAIFLSPAAQQWLGLSPGDAIALRAGTRIARLRVAGTVDGVAAGQRLAVMDVGAMQWRLDWLGRLSRIDLRIEEGVPPETVSRRLRAVLPPDVEWATPESAQQRMSNLSRAYRVNLSVLALVALFTGGFIVYSTLALAVVRMQHDLALMGVLGAPRRFAATQVLGLGAALGTAGAVAGVAGGVALAQLLLRVVGGDLGGGYFAGSAPSLALDPPALAAFGAAGVVTGLAGAWVPARAVRSLPAARALRSGSAEDTLARRAGVAIPAALFAAGAALLALPPWEGLPIPSYLAIVAWLFAGIALVPAIVSVAARRLGRRLAPASPVAWLALQRVRGAPGSAAAALSGVVASFALASAMAVMVASFRTSVDGWLESVLPADVYGRMPGGAASASIDPELQRRIAALEGFARVEFARTAELSLSAERPPVTLFARPVPRERPGARLPLTGPALAPPAGAVPVWVTEAIVDLYGARPGEAIELPIPIADGAKVPRFVVAGVWRDYARQHGAIAIDLEDWQRLTGDAGISDVALWLEADRSAADAIAAIRSAAPELDAMELRSASDIRALSLRIFDRSFAVTWVLEAVAIVVALFGVASTWAGEALARSREFGMLRHLGVTRREIAGQFAVESAVLLAAGVAWGFAIGAAIALVLVHRVNPQSFHWTMDVSWPAGLLLAAAGALVVSGVAAAVLASRHATGTAPVRAVREDW